MGPKYLMADLKKKKLLELCKSCIKIVQETLLFILLVGRYSF